MTQLDIVDVGHSYTHGVEEERWALKPLELTFEAGKTYTLVGPSGCGKTTLLNILSGLVRPSQGQVLFDGADVTALPTRARNIAQVFQFPVIYQSMTVYENLAFPLQCRRWDRARIDAKVRQVAEALDLDDRLGQPARRLTADDKQLISLGRGLVRDDVAAVLMDEPLTVIDPQLKHSLRRKIREITGHAAPSPLGAGPWPWPGTFRRTPAKYRWESGPNTSRSSGKPGSTRFPPRFGASGTTGRSAYSRGRWPGSSSGRRCRGRTEFRRSGSSWCICRAPRPSPTRTVA